jgi:hypothetical protein
MANTSHVVTIIIDQGREMHLEKNTKAHSHILYQSRQIIYTTNRQNDRRKSPHWLNIQHGDWPDQEDLRRQNHSHGGFRGFNASSTQ